MIIVTGGAGFIGSCLVAKLNSLNKRRLVVVDDFSDSKKNKNLKGKIFENKIDRTEFIEWFQKNTNKITEVYHIGARTDTTEFDSAIQKVYGKYVLSMKSLLFMLLPLQLMVWVNLDLKIIMMF